MVTSSLGRLLEEICEMPLGLVVSHPKPVVSFTGVTGVVAKMSGYSGMTIYGANIVYNPLMVKPFDMPEDVLTFSSLLSATGIMLYNGLYKNMTSLEYKK